MSELAEDIADSSSQRQDQRISVYASGTLCVGSEEDVACELLNVSAGGAMVRAEVGDVADQAVLLDLPAIGRLGARVAWQHNQFLGLAFEERFENVEEVVRSIATAAHAPDEKRGFKRTSVLWRGRLYAGGKTHEIRVLNISPTGAKIRGPSLAENTPIMLMVERAADVPARVVWSSQEQLGIRFLDASDEICDVFGDLLPSLRAYRRGDADAEPR